MKQASITGLAAVIAVLVAQLPAVRRQWLEDREGAIKSLRLLVYYFAYCAAGIALLVSTIREGGAGEDKAAAGVGFMLGWIVLSALWPIKLVPRYRSVPVWLLKPFGIPTRSLSRSHSCAR